MASKSIRKKTSYRYSSTFYRKLKKITNGQAKFETKTELQSSSEHEQYIDTYANKEECDFFCSNVEDALDNPRYNDSSDLEEIIISVSKFTLWQQIKKLSLTHKLSHNVINGILELFNWMGIHLPRDSRTLLKTPRNLKIETMGNGEFWYNGIRNCLNTVLSQSHIKHISLVINIDGLAPFKSAQLDFWPILFKIDEMKKVQPMVAAIYCGQTKPPLQSFLAQFVTEMTDLLKHGIMCNGNRISVGLKYFVCDTPARSFIKGTVGFNASAGCIKFTVVGEFDKKGRHMSFPRLDCPLRTDKSFRQKINEDHHKEQSPLEKLPIDMVEDIIIADSLHLFHLGVMRKCLNGWVHGSYNFKTKFCARDIDLLCSLLEECNMRKPFEIPRAIRSLKSLKFWKGSEYKTFLLYIGIVVLKDFLSVEVYHNYLSLFCAVTILSCNQYLQYSNIAHQLLIDFIEQFIDIYGQDSISSNIHNLCHVVKDVNKFGCLPEISTYPFENYLGSIKYLMRSGNRPLAQIGNRLMELSSFNLINSESHENKPYVKYEICEKHPLNGCNKIFNRLHISNDFILSNDIKNKWFLSNRNDIVSMVNATYFQNAIHIYGATIKHKKDFFGLPIKSSYLNIYQSDGQQYEPKLFRLSDIKCKLFCLKYRENFIFLPLLHTLR